MSEWIEDWSALGEAAADGSAAPAIVTDRVDDVFDMLSVDGCRVLLCQKTGISKRVIARDSRNMIGHLGYRYLADEPTRSKHIASTGDNDEA